MVTSVASQVPVTSEENPWRTGCVAQAFACCVAQAFACNKASQGCAVNRMEKYCRRWSKARHRAHHGRQSAEGGAGEGCAGARVEDACLRFCFRARGHLHVLSIMHRISFNYSPHSVSTRFQRAAASDESTAVNTETLLSCSFDLPVA